MMVRLAESLPRLEDARLIRGAGRYTDDLAPPDALWLVVVRSPHAHAAIVAIDTVAAAKSNGVLAVLTAKDYAADGLGPVPHAANPPAAHDVKRQWFSDIDGDMTREWGQPPLALDRVRFVGEAVSVVVAHTLAQARDGADLVTVEYSTREPVIDAQDALAPTAPQLWETAPGNLALYATLGQEKEVETALEGSTLVLQRTFHNQRIVNCQMEPRAAFARYDEKHGYTIVAGSQGVLRQRMGAAAALREPPERVRMVSPDVGGGFGPRTALNMEPVLVAWAARRLGRPVRWRSDRTEAFLADFQGRDQWTEATIGFDADGRIQALRSRQLFNLGAYPASFAPAGNGQRIVTTAYVVPCAWVETKGALTNTVPTVPYRGAGRPEAHFAIERLLDIAAVQLGIDRIEIRRRNLIPRYALPYRTPTGLVYDSGDMPGNMDAALALADWTGFSERREKSIARGWIRGIGIGNYVESPVGAAIETVTLAVEPDGTIDMVAGTQSTGQGHETTFVQIAAALLRLPHTSIRLRTGDTAFVRAGGGTHSDRSARLLGALLDKACPALIEKGRQAVGLLLGRSFDTIDYDAGVFRVADAALSFCDLAGAYREKRLPLSFGQRLEVTETIAQRIPAHPTGCAICEVEIDPETGRTDVVKYSSVDDVGQPINPLIVDGQVHGGIAQGVGQALYETMIFEPGTGQAVSASYMDYSLPKADDLPNFTVDLTEDPTTVAENRMRIKGGGEGGITPATAAVINAVVDALSVYGIDHIEMPATPARVWAAIREARQQQADERTTL